VKYLRDMGALPPEGSPPEMKGNMKLLNSAAPAYPPGPYSKFYDVDQRRMPKPDSYSNNCECTDDRLCWHHLPEKWTSSSATNAVNTAKLSKLREQREHAELQGSVTIQPLNASDAMVAFNGNKFSRIQFAAARDKCLHFNFNAGLSVISSDTVRAVLDEPITHEASVAFTYQCQEYHCTTNDYQNLPKKRNRVSKKSADMESIQMEECKVAETLDKLSAVQLDFGSWADKKRAIIITEELAELLTVSFIKLTCQSCSAPLGPPIRGEA
jgi:hypothetical protein